MCTHISVGVSQDVAADGPDCGFDGVCNLGGGDLVYWFVRALEVIGGPVRLEGWDGADVGDDDGPSIRGRL